MTDIKNQFELWLESTKDNAEIQAELLSVRDDDEAILDRFYKNLEFGTAGLRGVLGAGTNRMNSYVVCRATQGLADYLNGKFESSSVAIGYDSRIKSDEFAKECACVLAANGIKVHLYPHLIPTPFVSYAVMRLKCKSGIVITASHNPSKYNGYKCYDPDGYQMTEQAAGEVYKKILATDIFSGVNKMPFEEAISKGLIEYIPESLIEEFCGLVLERPINPDVIAKSGVSIIYTPLNGTGNKPVREVLSRAGFDNIRVVKAQEMPDGTFPTCPYPNPEIRQVFDLALDMAREEKADLLLATDPDCDRVGIAVPHGDDYVLLSGNEVGVLLTEYMLSQRQAKGTLPENPVMTKSLVSTNLVDAVAAKYGCKVVNVLTGFKYVGEFVTELAEKGEENRFIMGFEEAYGYLIGTHARDKDGVSAALMVSEMAAYYKTQGKTLVDVLDDIYAEHGACCNKLYNFVFEGAQGMVRMQEIMAQARENPPQSLAGMEVKTLWDYSLMQVTDTASGAKTSTGLPPSNILAYGLPNGNLAIVRPSGTEPKIKVYVTGFAADKAAAEKTADDIGLAMKTLLKVEG